MRRCFTAILATLLYACTTSAQSAQNLAARVAAAPDGTIAFSYPARAGVCGDGRTFIAEFTGPGQQNIFYSHGTSFTTIGGDFHTRCTEGPVRVVLTKRSGDITDLFVFVGPTTDARPVRTDLGSVAAQEAADYLLGVARRLPGFANDAYMAASLGAGARISVALLEHARDQRVSAETRESAVKWIGRTTEREGTVDQALPALRGIATNREEQTKVRERAVRALGDFTRGDAELRAIYARLDQPELRERAMRIFAEVGGSANTAFIRGVAVDATEAVAVRERAVRVLGEELGRLDVVRELYPQLDRSALRERAVRSLAEHLTSESAQWIRGIAENQNEDVAIRERAIRTLGEAGYMAQVRALYARLDHISLKERVIRAAGEHGSAEDRRWIEQIAVDERESDQLRERAVRILDDEGVATARLVAIFDQVQSHQLRDRLLRLLGERGDDAAIDKLINVARSTTDLELRRRAMKLLAESNDPRAREFLRTTVTK